MKIFMLSPKSTKASEKSGKPGDNALFVVAKYLKKFGCELIATEVAFLPDGKPIPLKRRFKALEHHKNADVTIVMGSDTERVVKGWFPVQDCIRVPQPFFYMNEPGRIKIELMEKIRDACEQELNIFGYDPETNSFR